jgi:CYTH domain-containing protein
MEIEKKYLIKKKRKNFPSLFEIKILEKEIIKKGFPIIQYYLPIKLIPKNLIQKINFKPNEMRLRETKNKYFLTIKSKGSLIREEFEMQIKKDFFEKYKKLKQKKLYKIRLIKKYKNKILEFDYYPNYDMITMEIEFKSIDEANKFHIKGKEITGRKKYKSRNLAK